MQLQGAFWALPVAVALTTPFLSTPTSEHEHLLHVVGHCHIDTAWLWPYRCVALRNEQSLVLRLLTGPSTLWFVP